MTTTEKIQTELNCVQENDREIEAILDRAWKKFKVLQPSEEELFRHLVKGTIDYTDSETPKNNPDKAEEWGLDRVLRADHVAWVCTDPEVYKLLPCQGLKIIKARIEGQLDLQFAQVNIPLSFQDCYFTEALLLQQAKLRTLELKGTRVGSSNSEDPNNSEKKLSLSINAEGINVEGNISLNGEFQAKGLVKLSGATIGGNLNCTNGKFNSPKNALLAIGMDVKGSVFLRKKFHAQSTVRLSRATIGGQLDCSEGQFNSPKNALLANGVDVKGDVYLNNVQAKGTLALFGISIGGNLNCSRGQFNSSKNVLLANGVDVKGDVVLTSSDAKAKVKIDLRSARINESLEIKGISNTPQIEIDLQFAKLQTLIHAENSWKHTRLHLQDLIYDSISFDATSTNQPTNNKRNFELNWLRQQLYSLKSESNTHFFPQPYEQLAKVLKSKGEENKAIQVLIGKEDDRRKYDGLNGLGKCWNWCLGVAIRHGYRPERAVGIALVPLIIGGFVFNYGNSQKLITPTEACPPQTSLLHYKEADECPNYEAFNPFFYSLDVLLPIVDLHLESEWIPNVNWLRWYLWFQIFIGWILTSLIVAGFSGLIRSSK